MEGGATMSDTTCRVCKARDERLKVKYGTRHYAHGACYLERFGFAGTEKLHDWQVAQLPWIAILDRFTAKQVATLQRRIITRSK
jgi:hypothetical protein